MIEAKAKTIFITGATSGFGEACAKLFAQNGWQLILAARRTEKLTQLQTQLTTLTKVHTITLDVRDRNAVTHSFNNLPPEFAPIDVLLNNAGLALGRDPAHQSDLNDWQIMVDTNIYGVMYCSHAALPNMLKHNHGHIINIGSIAATNPYPGSHVYGASKAFVKQFSRNLRCDLVGTGIKVSVIEPGLSRTEFSLMRFNHDIHKEASLYADTYPLSADDIAASVYWVATQPNHVNITTVEIMPTCQANGPMVIARNEKLKGNHDARRK
jgi:NADP-dependent 3-hydroxy acid dehydrogenase YdfG